MTINLDEIVENEPIVIILDGVAKTFYKPQVKIYGKKHKLCRRGGKEIIKIKSDNVTYVKAKYMEEII